MKSKQMRRTFAVFMIAVVLSWATLPAIAMAAPWLTPGKEITGTKPIKAGEPYKLGQFIVPGDFGTLGKPIDETLSNISGQAIIPIIPNNSGLFWVPNSLNGMEYGEWIKATNALTAGKEIVGGTTPSGGQAPTGGTAPSGGNAPEKGQVVAGGEGPNGGQVGTGGEGPNGGQVGTGGEGPNGGQVGPGGEGPNGGQAGPGGDGPNGGQGSIGGDGPNGGQGSIGGDGPNGGQGSIGGDGSNGGQGSISGDSSNGGQGSIGGDGSNGGQGSIGSDSSNGGQGSIGGDSSNGGQGSIGGEGSNGSQSGIGPTIDSAPEGGTITAEQLFAEGPSMLNALVKTTDGDRGIFGQIVGLARDTKTFWFGFAEKLIGPYAAYQAGFDIKKIESGKAAGQYAIKGNNYVKNSILNRYFQKFKEYKVNGETKRLGSGANKVGQGLVDSFYESKKVPLTGNPNKTKWQLVKAAVKSSVDDAINIRSSSFWAKSNINKLNGPLNVVLSSANSVLDYTGFNKTEAGQKKAKIGIFSTDFAADLTTDVAIGVGITAASTLVGSMASGALVGSVVPIPIVGTLVGAIVGLGVGMIGTGLLNTRTGRAVKQFARDGVKAVYDGAVKAGKGIWESGKNLFGNVKSIWSS